MGEGAINREKLKEEASARFSLGGWKVPFGIWVVNEKKKR